MRTCYAFPATLLLLLTRCVSATPFYIKDKWVGQDFFQGWNWETEDDPTHGRVNYVNQADAFAKNLSYGTVSRSLLFESSFSTGAFSADNNSFVMRADDWSIINPSARGRDSVRISSQTAYGDSVIVLDLAHMPAGCGTWPAFWTLSQQGPWPNGGEIDIIEGMLLVSRLLSDLLTCVQVSICNSPIKPRYILRQTAKCRQIRCACSLGMFRFRVHGSYPDPPPFSIEIPSATIAILPSISMQDVVSPSPKVVLPMARHSI